MGISGASVTPAATAAAAGSGNLVNVAVGYPAPETYPGPVDPVQYTDAGPAYPVEGPAAGPWVLDDWTGSVPVQAPGGGTGDTSWTTGTDAPMTAWDSSAGAPFAPSGALNPDLHGQDTGAVFAAQHVPAAFIGSLTRHTGTGQTWNREYAFEPVQGQYVPAPNGRTDMDQAQYWDPAPGDGGGWAPWDPGYSERPVLNNLAYQATPVTQTEGIYGVSGDLPDRSQWQAYAAQAYEAPPDPAVASPGVPAASLGGGGWVLG